MSISYTRDLFMTRTGAFWIRLQLHGAIYRPDSFVLMLCYCANLKAIRYESTSLNRIVADKLHRFCSNSLIHILMLSNSHNNVASIIKNRGDKSHRVIVALSYNYTMRFIGYDSIQTR